MAFFVRSLGGLLTVWLLTAIVVPVTALAAGDDPRRMPRARNNTRSDPTKSNSRAKRWSSSSRRFARCWCITVTNATPATRPRPRATWFSTRMRASFAAAIRELSVVAGPCRHQFADRGHSLRRAGNASRRKNCPTKSSKTSWPGCRWAPRSAQSAKRPIPRTRSIWPRPATIGPFSRPSVSPRRDVQGSGLAADRYRPLRPRRARTGHGKLKPVADADRVTLMRRVTFDLTGLPPTPAEIDAFTSDKSAGAWESLVDRLLASPALWRAVGPALAGCGPLWRIDRQGSQPAVSLRLAISRLRDRRLQRGQAVRSFHHRATCRRSFCRRKMPPSAIG